MGYHVYLSATLDTFYWICNYLIDDNKYDPYILGEVFEDAPYNSIDCGTNTELFLALAGMRSGTDKEQWFVCEESYSDPMLDYQLIEVGMLVKQGEFDQYAKAFYRQASVIEIINYHKQKGA